MTPAAVTLYGTSPLVSFYMWKHSKTCYWPTINATKVTDNLIECLLKLILVADISPGSSVTLLVIVKGFHLEHSHTSNTLSSSRKTVQYLQDHRMDFLLCPKEQHHLQPQQCFWPGQIRYRVRPLKLCQHTMQLRNTEMKQWAPTCNNSDLASEAGWSNIRFMKVIRRTR